MKRLLIPCICGREGCTFLRTTLLVLGASLLAIILYTAYLIK